jgi:hypothetical protein
LTNQESNLEGGTRSSPRPGGGDSAFATSQDREEVEAARKELDDIHEHADPSKGDKEVDGGDRVKTDGATRGAADDQVTQGKRSI